METSTSFIPEIQNLLLACGILYAVLTFGTDILAGFLTRGYRFDTQTANTFGGVGTPTRRFVLPSNLIAGLLLIAFSIGVWMVPGGSWALRVMACLLAGSALLSMAAVALFPFHPADPQVTPENKKNLMLMAPAVILFVLALVFAAIGNTQWMRYVSIGILALFVLGVMLSTFIYKLTRRMGASTGIQERTMIYAEMIWIILQAVALLQL